MLLNAYLIILIVRVAPTFWRLLNYDGNMNTGLGSKIWWMNQYCQTKVDFEWKLHTPYCELLWTPIYTKSKMSFSQIIIHNKLPSDLQLLLCSHRPLSCRSKKELLLASFVPLCWLHKLLCRLLIRFHPWFMHALKMTKVTSSTSRNNTLLMEHLYCEVLEIHLLLGRP